MPKPFGFMKSTPQAESFYSEFKTDRDIERLPSGKFATNDLVLAMATRVYNVLRPIGLTGLIGPHAPVRHEAKRRRLRTVMQALMDLAARLIHHGRRWTRRFGQHGSGFHRWLRSDQRLAEPFLAVRHTAHPALASVGAPAQGASVTDKGFAGQERPRDWPDA